MTEIQNKLNEILHYSKIPEMKPYIGTNYWATEKKVLIIGESHFFNHEPSTENPKCNPGAQVWYSYNVEIPQEKLDCINTSESVKKGKHRFFINLKEILSEALQLDKQNVLEHICFMNAFQRPANHTGVGMEKLVQEQDCLVAIDTITEVINILKPNFVIFVSKLSWEKIGKRITNVQDCRIDYTSHPNSHDWNSGNEQKNKLKILSILN